jgi:putative hydrolase of the HAD superfamily
MPARPPQVRAVLFDFFGTLTRAVRRGPRHAVIARSLGCDPQALIAELDRTFYARAGGGYGGPIEGLRRVTAAIGGHPSEERLAAAVRARARAVREDGPLRPEAVPVLAELKVRGLRTAVVSDCWHELPAFLPGLPVAGLLDTCVYSIDVGHTKPHPAMYLTACAQLDVEPQECLYVGDGGSQELTGALAVGMPAVRLTAPDLAGHLVFATEERWDGPAVERLDQVVELLGAQPALR